MGEKKKNIRIGFNRGGYGDTPKGGEAQGVRSRSDMGEVADTQRHHNHKKGGYAPGSIVWKGN